MFPPEDHETPDQTPSADLEAEDAGSYGVPAHAPASASNLFTCPAGESPPASSDAEDELADWKDALRRQFEAWLDDLDQIPELEADGERPETPDLYSFYAQWTTANAEARKSNRRTAEAFSQWGGTLGRFDGDLKLLREQLQRLAAAAPSEGMSRAHCLVLAELLDRLQRLARAFASPPPVSWWGGTNLWRQAWENQRQALDILLGHFESLLKKEGLTPIETTGRPFDPASMTAVAAEPDQSRPDQTILEEIAPGYRLRGELLRAAQVKVSLNKTSSPKA
jgi:molecular chaperone GrpE (heat shock protein)